uniref:G-patch domain-containing protein n=1 Tax=Meloidogyne javanica TaxID=6303 RepID=A0A915LIP7_MELJA
MSMLAEPRRKQRISVDPQNLNWVNNEKTFGKKLMKQMGWKGGGLGPEGVGIKDCVKTKANNDQRVDMRPKADELKGAVKLDPNFKEYLQFGDES